MSIHFPRPAEPEQIIASIEEYIRALKPFDWHYEFSDDSRVYWQGNARMKVLRTAQRELDPSGTIWSQYERR